MLIENIGKDAQKTRLMSLSIVSRLVRFSTMRLSDPPVTLDRSSAKCRQATLLSFSSSHRGGRPFHRQLLVLRTRRCVSHTHRSDGVVVLRLAEDEPVDDVAAFQHPSSSATFLKRSPASVFAAPTNLTCLAVATLSAAPSTSLTVSKSFSPVTLFHWAFPQRLSELRVDVALPVLAEVDIRDCWVAYHPQSNSRECNAAPFTGDVRGRRRT